MTEIIFHVFETEEGGFSAKALGEAIFTEADSILELRELVRDAVLCHFDEAEAPKSIRLIFTREEVMPLAA